MAMNFPASPTDGETIAGPGGVTWTWDGTKWTFTPSAGGGGGGGASVGVGDTPPANPALGDLWWASDIGELFIWYDDGTSAQWVIANSNTLGFISYAQLPVTIQQIPIVFGFAAQPIPAGMVIVPVSMAFTIVANLIGSTAHVMINPTAAVTFTLNRIRASATVALGTVLIATTGVATFAGAGGSLVPGDTLQMLAPVTQDATLSDVGITILGMRA